MVQPVQKAVLLPADYVSLSFWGFTFWWLVIYCVYVVTCANNAGCAKFYWDFNTTFLSYTLETYGVGMPRETFRTIAHVHIIMAAIHGVYAATMVVGSLRQRTLAFSFSPTRCCRGSSETIDIKSGKDSRKHKKSIVRSASYSVWNITTTLYQKIADRNGVLGVSGRHFHNILICRELFETGLQTVQAVPMSRFLPRLMLNRFYVCLLAVNCWSSVFIYSRWFWKDEAWRRFAAIVCDCVLDLMSTMGVSILIVLSYVKQYNVVLTGFNFELLEDDEWVAQMLNEAQMVVVASWSDLAIRFIFSIGLIITTTNMKELLNYTPRSGNRVAHSSGSGLQNALALVSPSFSAEARAIPPNAAPTESNQVTQPTTKRPHATAHRNDQILFHGVHILFAGWGAVVLILYIHASIQASLVECMPRVHPMAGALPSCFMVNFDCHQLGISGERKDVEAEWNKFEPNTAVKLQFLHCAALEVPDKFKMFRQLAEIRVYNSTILEWGAEAAITNVHRPEMTSVSIVRVNLTDGLLPLGFQSRDFPLNLNQIYFCETNLQSLPDDLDTKWHIGSNIYVENSMVTVVPDALMRLQPYYLTLAGNLIAEFPPKLFEDEYLQYIVIGRTKARELPQSVPQPIMGPVMIDISNTNISFFWSWIDPLVENMWEITAPIIAGGSKYCSERNDILNGISDNFSEPFQEGHSPLLMNASEANWDILRAAVDCSPVIWETRLPLKFWDRMYAITEEYG